LLQSQAHFAKPIALYFGDLYIIQSAKRAINGVKSKFNKAIMEDCVRLWAWKVLDHEGYGD
jgi:hypothetical protein